MGSVNDLLSPLPPPPTTRSSSSSSYKSFPILVISILGIITIAIILVSYYVFVIRCSINRRRRPNFSTSQALPTTTKSRGLEESAIRAIPTLRFKRNDDEKYYNRYTKGFSHDCSVCLDEFEEEEKLRVLPSCSHIFHIDCIDTWLQTSHNCPTCRFDINLKNPTFSLPSLTHNHQSSMIDVRDEAGSDMSQTTTGQQNPSAEKVREREEQLFSFLPSRSFSVDSSSDGKLYFEVQEILRQEQYQSSRFREEEGNSRSNDGRI